MIASTSTCSRRMSSLSMIVMSERMVFGGAVTIERVGLRVGPDHRALLGAARRAPPPRRGAAAGGGLRDAGDLLLQLRGDLLGIGVMQVAHLRVAAVLQRAYRDARSAP